jgi:Heterokaryon incompatibility protein (HET)
MGSTHLTAKHGPHSLKPLENSTESIRLIEILPAWDAAAPIQCKFYVFPVSKSPPFIALSYTWGDPKPPIHHIELEGASFPIRANLWEALRSIRSNTARRITGKDLTPVSNETPGKDKPPVFQTSNPSLFDLESENAKDVLLYWVNQICVDQNNILERNHQVCLMKDIYSMATEVLVWLGVSQRTTVEAAAIVFIQKGEWKRWNLELLAMDHEHQHDSIPDQLVLEGYESLCIRMYWTRMWIVQEIMLAKSVRVRSSSGIFMLEDFFGALDFFQALKRAILRDHTLILRGELAVGRTIDGLSNSGAGRIFMIKNMLDMHISSGHQVTLQKLVVLCRNQGYSDARDKVFAFLSLLSEPLDHSGPPVADYSKSLFEVYSMAVEAEIAQRERDAENIFDFGVQLLKIMGIDIGSGIVKSEMARLFSKAVVRFDRPNLRKFLDRQTLWQWLFELLFKDRPDHVNFYIYRGFLKDVDKVFDPSTAIKMPILFYSRETQAFL